MEEKQEQERSFEIRSEKVRSIIGQIPSSLVQYSITAIGIVLFVLSVVVYLLPYKKTYTGTAVIRPITNQTESDSIETVILLRFNRSALFESNKQSIRLTNGTNNAEGVLFNISSIRDTLGRQEAICRFRKKELKTIENSMVYFHITVCSGNLMREIIR